VLTAGIFQAAGTSDFAGIGEVGLLPGILEIVQLAGTFGVAEIFEVQQFALQAGIFEIGVEAGISVELAVAAKVVAVAVAVEEEAVVVAAHGVSAVVADLHRIEQPVGSVEHGREK